MADLQMNRKHFVYFIESGACIKIGHSEDPEGRRRKLQVGNPIRLVGLGKIACDCERYTSSRGRNCSEASRLQGVFRDSKVASLDPLNEWYHKSPELLQYIVDHRQDW